jgi:MFS family permease
VRSSQHSRQRHLFLGTISFTVCFAAWGLISAFAPVFRQRFHLSATQTAFLVAVPVLLGALARLPMGMLADRFGGRVDFCCCPPWPVFCGGRTHESSCRVKMSYKQNSRPLRFGPPTQFDPVHGRRCGRAFSSPPLCSVRAICRISIPRLSSTPSRSSSLLGVSSFTIRSGFGNRRPASIGSAAGSCSGSAASFAVSLTLFPSSEPTCCRRPSSQGARVAMGHASVDFLGMPASGCDHLSARIRVDLFHERSQQSDGLRDPSFRLSRGSLPPTCRAAIPIVC